MKRASLVNLSVLLVSVIFCALVLEVASRILFEAPPSVVVENLADPAASIGPLLELMKQVGNERGIRVAVMLLPVCHQVQSELLVDESQQEFERHMTELGLAHIDLLPLLREKYEQDGVNVFYDHSHYRPEGYEYFLKFAADFLLNEVISG